MIGTKKLLIIILIILTLALTGCFDFLQKTADKTTYAAHPIKAKYTISYGYDIVCEGIGEFNILYDCDIPEVLNGQLVSISEHNPDYSNVTLVNNPMKRWNITDSNTNSYQLGITAEVTAESFIISDLTGKGALTISEIKNQHFAIYSKYTNAQSNDTLTFIDPDNPLVKSVAQNILSKANSNNSFILAKNLFIWLKENTDYEKHFGDESVQPVSKTCQLLTGDCDDLSFLYISLCRAIGIPARFIRGFTVEEKNRVVEIVPHAWAEVFVGGGIGNNGWIPVECACSSDEIDIQINQNFGIEDVKHLRLFVDDGSNESLKVSFSDIKVRYDTNIVVSITAVTKILSYEILESKELVVENNYRTYQ